MSDRLKKPRPPQAQKRELAIAIAITLIGSCLAAFLCFTYLIKSQHSYFLAQAEQIEQRLRVQLTNSSQIVNSLAAIHQASDTGNVHRQFGIYAQGILETNDTVRAIGRYDQIDFEDVGNFSSVLKDNGIIQPLRKRALFQHGSALQDGQVHFSPIVNVQPAEPPLTQLIGLDLSTSAPLSRTLRAATSHNHLRVTSVPPEWQLGKQMLLLLQPTYFGHYAPTHPIDRLAQSDGGYWLASDTRAMLVNALPTSTTISAKLQFTLQNHLQGGVYSGSSSADSGWANSSSASINIKASDRPEILLTQWFKPFSHQAEVTVGSSDFALSLTTAAGVTVRGLCIATGTFSLASLFFSLAFFLRSLRKTSDQQIAQREVALHRERERALVTLESIGDGVITADANGVIDYYNQAADRLLSGTAQNLLGEQLVDALTFSNDDTDDLDEYFRLIIESSDTGSLKGARLNVQHASLLPTFVDVILSPLNDTAGKRIGSVLAMRDVTTEFTLSRELEYQATHDKLTKLPNRAAFERVLEKMIPQARQPAGNHHAICYIDLDQFKLINDTCSHAAGDLLLARLARELSAHLRNGDLLARLGGDEFGLLIMNTTPQQAEAIANRLHDFFQNYLFTFDTKIFAIHASIGLVHIIGQHNNVNEVLSEVDLACYSAKDSGRNTLHVYDASNEQTRQRYGEMLSLPVLQRALQENRFTLYVQPIAATSSIEHISHHEVLLRLIDEVGQIISPARFILAAERYDLMRDIDRWVITAAITSIASLKGTLLADHQFNINLSGQTLADPNVARFISDQIKRHNIKPQQLCFEITETSVVVNFDQAMSLLNHLRSLGCSIALDDFGAGVSSFGYLKKLTVDYLKIDGQFVREMVDNPVDHEMVRSIHNVSKALDIKTVAEYVEDDRTYSALAEMKIDYAQGYHISQPMPFHQLMDFHADVAQAA